MAGWQVDWTVSNGVDGGAGDDDGGSQDKNGGSSKENGGSRHGGGGSGDAGDVTNDAGSGASDDINGKKRQDVKYVQVCMYVCPCPSVTWPRPDAPQRTEPLLSNSSEQTNFPFTYTNYAI